ncbi:hypothetical protein [Rhodoligotrophos defluvii]|uniref:hypothetical protein n=1 Tax=Rhodoligotrophos defluvii TaxID=2561934 RepID=UPI0010C95448|nr:hypothetical protein [Rhodoligotrophos defluvii]
MAPSKEQTQRRVYVLPTELVDRIVAFQAEKGFPSEVEAVRKLLDEALKSRDTDKTIIRRFLYRLEKLRLPTEVAKDVLVGHPLVTDLSFGRDHIKFTISGYGVYRISELGQVDYYSSSHKRWDPWTPDREAHSEA